MGYTNLGSRANLLPSIVQSVYVSLGGSDTLGDGTSDNPFYSVVHAMSTITDASYTKRYNIYLSTGKFYETDLLLKPNVWITGQGAILTRYQASSINLDPSWNQTGDNRCGFANLEVVTANGIATIDFNAVTSYEGKFYLDDVWFVPTLYLNGYTISNINQAVFNTAKFFSDVHNTNMLLESDNNTSYGNIFCSATWDNPQNIFNPMNSTIAGNLTVTAVTTNPFTIQGYNSTIIGNISLSGSEVIMYATSDFIPLMNQVSTTNGASIVRLNDAFGVAYTPATPSNWNGNPTSLQNAIDRIAAAIKNSSGNPIP